MMSPGPAPETQPALRPMARLRAYLFAGIIVTAPISITFWIVWQIVAWVDATANAIIPQHYNPETYLPFSLPGLGLLFMLGVLVLIGWFTAGLVGKTIMRLGERVLQRMPVVRSIYGTLKQIFETVLRSGSGSFREVVLVEWPRRDCWSIGFVAGPASWELDGGPREPMIKIFLPCTPNPTTGYLMFVPRSDCRSLDMTVEEGMRLVISGGIIDQPLRPPPPEAVSAPSQEPQRVRPVEEVQ